jgi:hypothetical protein
MTGACAQASTQPVDRSMTCELAATAERNEGKQAPAEASRRAAHRWPVQKVMTASTAAILTHSTFVFI